MANILFLHCDCVALFSIYLEASDANTLIDGTNLKLTLVIFKIIQSRIFSKRVALFQFGGASERQIQKLELSHNDAELLCGG